MIIKALSKWDEIQKAAIFGSRAVGNYRRGSDVDLVIYGAQVTDKIVVRLSTLLNQELPLPYYFDVVHYESLKNEQLRIHIDTYARLFYKSGRRSSFIHR